MCSLRNGGHFFRLLFVNDRMEMVILMCNNVWIRVKLTARRAATPEATVLLPSHPVQISATHLKIWHP